MRDSIHATWLRGATLVLAVVLVVSFAAYSQQADQGPVPGLDFEGAPETDSADDVSADATADYNCPKCILSVKEKPEPNPNHWCARWAYHYRAIGENNGTF